MIPVDYPHVRVHQITDKDHQIQRTERLRPIQTNGRTPESLRRSLQRDGMWTWAPYTTRRSHSGTDTRSSKHRGTAHADVSRRTHEPSGTGNRSSSTTGSHNTLHQRSRHNAKRPRVVRGSHHGGLPRAPQMARRHHLSKQNAFRSREINPDRNELLHHVWWPQGLPHGTPPRRINGTNHLFYPFRPIPIHPPPNGDLPFRRQLRESLLPDLRRPTYCKLRGRYVRVHCNITRNANTDKGDCRKSRQVQRFFQCQEDNRGIYITKRWLRRIPTGQKWIWTKPRTH